MANLPVLLGTDGQGVTIGELSTPKKGHRQRRPASPPSALWIPYGGTQAVSGESSAAPAPEKKSKSKLRRQRRRYSVLYRTLQHTGRDGLHLAAPGESSAASAGEESLIQMDPKIQSSFTCMDPHCSCTCKCCVENITFRHKDLGSLDIEVLDFESYCFDWSDAELKQEIDRFKKQLNCSLPDVDDDFWSLYDGQELKRLNERLALHRIKAHKISEGALLEELIDAKLIEEYPPAILEDNEYFQWYESDFEWYFDTKYCRCVGFGDYQRLALRNDAKYLNWDMYHETYSTYQGDQEFVEFYENLSSKLKYFNSLRNHKQLELLRYQRLAFYQAVKIAAGYNNIFLTLVYTGLPECLQSIRLDNSTYKEISSLYFEIWKRVALQKMNFVTANI